MFINYRREDSHSYGALLYRDLTDRFGKDLVFLDFESIPAGADFVEQLLGRVRSARAVLAVIGRQWLTVTDPAGHRRIDDPDDWVRRELAEALASTVRVIPILTDHAELPSEADLPAEIAALSRCQYRHLRRGETTTDLARIVTDLTSHDPVLAAAASSRDNAPRQLPAAPGLFTGRAVELAALTDAATSRAADVADTVAISAISGAGGIGKTALALHWAYQHLHLFPDGQLHVNLRGFDPSGQPISVDDAVRGFLIGLGVDPSTMPDDLDARVARYRGLVAGKRILIVLDNARDVDHVIPLLPGSTSCTVLVTSRHHLTGLAALYGAHLLDLDVLPEADARDLLARHLGPCRLVEPEAVAELLAVCAGLPLAVRIVAARAQHHPAFPLMALAEELRETSACLDGLDAGDLRTNVRAVLSWSVRMLSPQAARMFGLLSSAPGPDIDVHAAVSLAALPEGQIRAVAQELEHASLLQQYAPGRYRMHDLIRLYATEAALHDLADDAREAALRRVLDFYLHTAHIADQLLDPYRQLIQLDRPAPGVHPRRILDASAALAWFDTEHPNLLAAQRTAGIHGWHQAVWQLGWILDVFHFRRGHSHDRLAVSQAGVVAAEHLPDPTTRSLAHRVAGLAHAHLGRHEEALSHLHQALALAEVHEDHSTQAHTHVVLSWAWQYQEDYRQALEHATRALTSFRTLDEIVWTARALNQVGRFTARLGDYDRARHDCQAALTLNRRHQDADGEAETLTSLGYIADRSGHHAEAIEHYHKALSLFHPLGNSYSEADILVAIGRCHLALLQYDQARIGWRKALELYQQQGRDADGARVRAQLDDLDKGASAAAAATIAE